MIAVHRPPSTGRFTLHLLCAPFVVLAGIVRGVYLACMLRRAETLFLRAQLEARHAVQAFADGRINLREFNHSDALYDVACMRLAYWRAVCRRYAVPVATSPAAGAEATAALRAYDAAASGEQESAESAQSADSLLATKVIQ